MKKNYFNNNGTLRLEFIKEFIEKFVKQQTNKISIYSNLIEIVFPKYCKIIEYISYKDFAYFTNFLSMDEVFSLYDAIENIDVKHEFDTYMSNAEIKLSSEFYNNIYELLRKVIFEHFSGDIKVTVIEK